jgi:tuftelin-interacting protein 11
MSEDDMMRFEITDHDIDNEFNFDLRRPKITKNRATYGIWADSDEDEAQDARPSFGGSRKSGKGDYSAPVGFVSAGLKKSAKEEAEEAQKAASEQGGSSKRDSSGGEDNDDDTFSAGMGLGFKKKKAGGKSKSKKSDFVGTGEIAGLRGKTNYSQTVNIGKGFGEWEKHTKGIGAKILLQMGFKAGKGLGKELQGRSTVVEAHLRKGRGAVGAYGKEGNRPKDAPKFDSEEEEEQEFKDKLHQWKKGGSAVAQAKKVKYVYKSADQVLEDGKWRKVNITSGKDSSEASKMKIIDMTGKEQRVLSGYHAIGAQKMLADDDDVPVKDPMEKREVNFDLPELRHNIDLLLDQCEEELITTDRTLKHHKNRVEVLQREDEKIEVLLERERHEISTLTGVLESVEKLEAMHAQGGLDMNSARDMLAQLESKYPEEYRGLEMPYIAITIVVPLLKADLLGWNILEQPHRNFDEFLQWQELLSLSDRDSEVQPDPMDPFHALLWEAWMPCVRVSITSWNTRQPDRLIRFLEAWQPLIPRWMRTNIRDHIILPKLQAAVEMWDPRTDVVPIHSWLHPWLPLLGDQLEIVYPTIRNKLASALTAWHPSDKSAKLIVEPWRDIFTTSSMHSFILKNILPKLEQTIANELIINPQAQDPRPWEWVMDWKDFLPPAAMINLLERHFFPEWHRKLASWLNQNPNYDEVTRWYKGWKSLMPHELLNAPQVQHQLQIALDMMTRVVSNSGQPGAPEAMMYLNSIERQVRASEARIGASSAAPSISEAVRMASQMASAPSNLRDLIGNRCADRGIRFVPLPSRYQEGKQVYQCGTLKIYLDRNAIFVQDKEIWIPTSLNSLLDSVN